MPTINITDQNFDTEVLNSKKTTIVDFWAEWCGPCKQIGPVLEEISDEMKDKSTKVGASTKSNIVEWINENI